MNRWSVIILALTGFTISWLSIPLIQRFLGRSARRQLHQTHTAPVSRYGGLALALAFVGVAILGVVLFPAGVLWGQECGTIATTSLAMFLLGFVDDIWPLGAKRKLCGQVAIASIVYFAGIHIGSVRNPFSGVDYALGPASYFATVFWLVAFTNLINLIDGVDGLAGGISLMVMALLLYVGWHTGLIFPILCAAGMCGALLGFLYFNFPPAKIYLGDGGAYFLGFLIGLLAMVHSHKGTVVAALIAPLFVLALPIVDVVLAILRRGLRGVPIFRPDRRHLHHRLAEAGLSRTRIVLLFYAGSLLFLILGFGVFASQGRWLPFLFGLGCLLLLGAARSFSFSRDWFSIGKVLGNSLELRKQARYILLLGQWLELEAERCRAEKELWTDFTFIVRKIGFCAVTRSHPSGSWSWNDGTHPSNGKPQRKTYDLPGNSTLHFSAPASLDSAVFDLLSELAAEAWHKATDRWQQANQASVPSALQSAAPIAKRKLPEAALVAVER